MSFSLRIEPHDPIVARDGRPFGAAAGNRMKTLPWLYPSVLAGSVRTLLGKMADWDFTDPEIVAHLKNLAIHGPLAVRNGSLFVAPPFDAVLHPNDKKHYAARPTPWAQYQGWDLAETGLLPALLDDTLGDDFKPVKLPALWSIDAAAGWLAAPNPNSFTLSESDQIGKVPRHSRTHLEIDAATGAAREGMLFTTEGIEFSGGLHMSALLDIPPDVPALKEHAAALNHFNSLGGERRLARFTVVKDNSWSCPQQIAGALKASNRIRMQLVTPAIFKRGWRPEWICQNAGARLTLVAAALDRWRPISGWSYEKRETKAVRRVVPAGAVYFFESDQPLPDPKKLWLAPVSDDAQDRRDGFGLAIWGVW